VDARGQHVARGAVLLGALADEHQEIALRREQLEIAERGIDDVHVAVAVGGDLLGPGEVAELLADAAEGVQVAARGVEYLDAEIAAVDDVEVAVAPHREVARQVELARALAALADVEQ